MILRIRVSQDKTNNNIERGHPWRTERSILNVGDNLPLTITCDVIFVYSIESKKISNDQELIQSDPTSCPQNQKGNN